jgi:hypothetical protein
MKKLWFGMAGLGVVVFIVGLVLTIVLTNETGEERPDSECSSSMQPMRSSLVATCVVSNDPKVLLGVAPLLLGGAMVGIGLWRGITTASAESSTGGGGVSGVFSSLEELQEKAAQLQASAMGSIASAGATPPSPPPTVKPPPTSNPPPTPPAPQPPGADT